MFRISTFGLFLTCTENSFKFKHMHAFKMGALFLLIKIRYPSTWEGSPSVMVANVPSTLVSCSKSTALRPLHFPSPPALTTRTQNIYLTNKDDINKPDSSVGTIIVQLNSIAELFILIFGMCGTVQNFLNVQMHCICIHFDLTNRKFLCNLKNN